MHTITNTLQDTKHTFLCLANMCWKAILCATMEDLVEEKSRSGMRMQPRRAASRAACADLMCATLAAAPTTTASTETTTATVCAGRPLVLPVDLGGRIDSGGLLAAPSSSAETGYRARQIGPKTFGVRRVKGRFHAAEIREQKARAVAIDPNPPGKPNHNSQRARERATLSICTHILEYGGGHPAHASKQKKNYTSCHCFSVHFLPATAVECSCLSTRSPPDNSLTRRWMSSSRGRFTKILPHDIRRG